MVTDEEMTSLFENDLTYKALQNFMQNQDCLVAAFILANPDCKIENIRLIQQQTERGVVISVEYKPTLPEIPSFL